jgi:hypothetical protein
LQNAEKAICTKHWNQDSGVPECRQGGLHEEIPNRKTCLARATILAANHAYCSATVSPAECQLLTQIFTRGSPWVLLTPDSCNSCFSLFLTERNSRSAGIEYDQLDWLICRVATVHDIDAFRQGLPRLENLPFLGALLFQSDFAGQNISGVDHRVLMPIEGGISWDRDFENRYLGLAL